MPSKRIIFRITWIERNNSISDPKKYILKETPTLLPKKKKKKKKKKYLKKKKKKKFFFFFYKKINIILL